MKKIGLIKALTFALGFTFLVGCSEEQNVQPKSENNPEMGAYGRAGNDDHPQPNPACGFGKDVALVNAAGSETYALNQLPYGNISLRNDENIVWIGLNLNPALFTDLSTWYIGAASGAPTNQNGDFDLESFPNIDNHPYSNVWAWSTNAGGYGPCNNWVCYFEVFRASFFGGPNEATREGIWAKGTSQANGYVFEYCQDPCFSVTAPDGWCATVYNSIYQPGKCTDLTAAGSDGQAPYSYAWSTGETTATINVCTTTPTSYMVTVTDASGATAVGEYNVNVIDARDPRKPTKKVIVCHLPPGNPANMQEIRIGIPAIPAHVDPNRGHNSGCKLGPCGQVDPCSL